MTSTASKRKHSPSPEPPALEALGELTRDKIDDFFSPMLSDRQRMSWALQTETRVRLRKLQARESFAELSTTLDSEYLFEVYPEPNTDGKKPGFLKPKSNIDAETRLQLEKDRHAFLRKCHPLLSTGRSVDESFQAICALDLSGRHERNKSCLSNSTDGAPVPPNLLFFEIILEAYMGFKMKRYHSSDPTMPRGAVMGGAVVAALTAWRDTKVVRFFAVYDLENELIEGGTRYFQAKHRLVSALHECFLRSQSPFASGDVDIFLQPSALTRSLVEHLNQAGLNHDVRKHVESYIGGCGLVQGDLHRTATAVYQNEPGDNFSFVYALSKTALNAILAHDVVEYRREQSNPPGSLWPRPTQLIMLNEMADLLGGLMDFDISLVSCAYDGNGVRITPRAALSLLTMVLVVTPFIMEDKRNWQRITKYYKRGFDAYVIDPECRHELQCVQGPFAVQGDPPSSNGNVGSEMPLWRRNNRRRFASIWERSLDDGTREQFRGRRRRNRELTSYQEEHRQDVVSCCCGSTRYGYSVMLFEQEEGEVIDYFANIFKWSPEKRSNMEALDPRLRMICRKCRYKFEAFAFLKRHDRYPSSSDSAEEILQSNLTFQRTKKEFSPCFYSGVVFDSTRHGRKGYFVPKLLSTLRSQLLAEEVRYYTKTGSIHGYLPRFVYHNEHQRRGRISWYESDVDSVFQDASETTFAASGRPPVGLNPERFIARCSGCDTWLVNCEFNVKYCELCNESKPAAS